jgi:hypothetical protein
MIIEQSVQSLFITMNVNGLLLSTGTGFVVNSPKGPLLITNRHNLAGRRADGAVMSHTGAVPDEVVIRHNAVKLGVWVDKPEPLYAGGVPLWKEHALGAQIDVVALPLTNLVATKLYPVDLYRDQEVLLKPASIVSVIGFPFSLTAGGSYGVWATGFLASEPEIDYRDLPIQLIDCRSRPGQSGSPVVAYRAPGTMVETEEELIVRVGDTCRFVGVYSGRVHGESDIGIVWKPIVVHDLIAAL